MSKVAFRLSTGEEQVCEGKDGWSIMQTAMRNSVPGIDAECGGSASCATCHVYVDEPWLERVDPPESFEIEMLDMIPSRRPNSRLSCQVAVTADLDGITIEVPEEQTSISL